MKQIQDYFKKAETREDTIPKEWRNPPSPVAKPTKRPVGRPRLDVTPTKSYLCTTPTTPTTRTRSDDEREDYLCEEPSLRKIRGKYKFYTVAEKKELLDLAEVHGTCVIAEKYGLPKSTLSTWKKTFCPNSPKTPKGRKVGGGGKLVYSEDVELMIVHWIQSQRERQLPVTRRNIQMYAQNLVQTSNKQTTFKASDGWLARFFTRNNLSLRCKTPILTTATLKSAPTQDVVNKVAVAVRKMPKRPVMISKSIKVTGISNALTGHEDHFIQNSDEVNAILDESDDDPDFDGFQETDLTENVIGSFADCDDE